MDYIKFGLLLILLLAVDGSTGLEEPKQNTLLKLEGIEAPKLELLENNESERTANNDNRRGSPDVLLQILGLKDKLTTRPPPHWHTHKPTYIPHPPPHYPHYPYPHYPYPHYPYPHYPYYPQYPYWPYPYPYPYPPNPYPTTRPTRRPTPTPTPTPPLNCFAAVLDPNGELAPPDYNNCPPPLGKEFDLEPYYSRTDDDDDDKSSESVLRAQKKKRRLN